jgi:hypothetical protein
MTYSITTLSIIATDVLLMVFMLSGAMLSVTMLSGVILSVILLPSFVLKCCSQLLYAQRSYADCPYAKCHYTECRHAECRRVKYIFSKVNKTLRLWNEFFPWQYLLVLSFLPTIKAIKKLRFKFHNKLDCSSQYHPVFYQILNQWSSLPFQIINCTQNVL